jgi:hypothetical protein
MYPGINTRNDFFEYAVVMWPFSALEIKGLDCDNINISTMITVRPAEVVSTSMLSVAEGSSYECLLSEE